MASRIVHFGTDECLRLLVLVSVGYIVQASGISIPTFSRFLVDEPADAIAISEDDKECDQEAIAVSRSLSVAPIILFEGVSRRSPPPEVDLLISSQMFSTAQWLGKIEKLIQEGKETQEQARTAREHASELRKQSQALRLRAAATLESSAGKLYRKSNDDDS